MIAASLTHSLSWLGFLVVCCIVFAGGFAVGLAVRVSR